MTRYELSPGRPLLLGARLGGGGEGTVYDLIEPRSTPLVAKLYHNNSVTQDREQKILAMLKHPIKTPQATSGYYGCVAWPLAAVYAVESDVWGRHRRHVTGYIMPKVSVRAPLHDLYTARGRRESGCHLTYRDLYAIASNLASSVSLVHDAGHVVGDINESNALVQAKGFVTLIDADSFQIHESGGHDHLCRVCKAEFLAPELHGADLSRTRRTVEHDLWSLAVLIHISLNEGHHPFSGKRRFWSMHRETSLEENVRLGIRPHRSPVAPPERIVSSRIRELFSRAFEAGRVNPRCRPAAWEWKEALRREDSYYIVCGKNRRHTYWRDERSFGAGCPWCEHATRYSDLYPPINNSDCEQKAA